MVLSFVFAPRTPHWIRTPVRDSDMTVVLKRNMFNDVCVLMSTKI